MPRDVCLAKHAGYTEYFGLPGSVNTGCLNTPAYASRFCHVHTPLSVLSVDHKDQMCGTQHNDTHAQVAEMILDKRVTRNTVHHKVCVHDIMLYITIPMNQQVKKPNRCTTATRLNRAGSVAWTVRM